MRCARAVVFLVGVAALGASTGCVRVEVPEVPMGDPRPDGGDPFLDTDRDGLCDVTERGYGTDPRAADTDGDGLTDRDEIDLLFEPTEVESPGVDRVARLAEQTDAEASLEVSLPVSGLGENFTAVVLEAAFFPEVALSPEALGAVSTAVAAFPATNVAAIDGALGRFRGVTGLTDLVVGVDVRFGDNAPRECSQANPFRVAVKRSDGALVAETLAVVLTVPDAPTAEPCPRSGLCL